MLIRAFLLMQSAWSTLRQRSSTRSFRRAHQNAIRMEHAEAKINFCPLGISDGNAIRMEHAEAKKISPFPPTATGNAIRMEHAETKLTTMTSCPTMSMQSAWSTLRQRYEPCATPAPRVDAISMEHAETKILSPMKPEKADHAIRMEHAEAKDPRESVQTTAARCNPHGAR